MLLFSNTIISYSHAICLSYAIFLKGRVKTKTYCLRILLVDSSSDIAVAVVCSKVRIKYCSNSFQNCFELFRVFPVKRYLYHISI